MRNSMQHVKEDLSAYLAGQLSEAERSKVEAHLKECPDCTDHLQSEKKLNLILAKSSAIKPGSDFSSKVITELKRDQKTTTDWRIFIYGIAAAIAIAMFLIYIKQEIPKPVPAAKNPAVPVEKKPDIAVKEEAPLKMEEKPDVRPEPVAELSPEERELVANLDELENMEVITNLENLENLDLALMAAESEGSLQ